MIPSGKITPHFAWIEAACRCGECDGIPEDAEIQQNIIRLANALEDFRAAIGGRPIHITSWYRCKAHNERVGGTPNSLHLVGLAADFAVSGKSPSGVQYIIESWLKFHPVPFSGLGKYNSHTHVDLREAPAKWEERRSWVYEPSVGGRRR